MNLATLRLRVQSTVGLAATTTGHNEQTLVDGWFNESVEQFLVRTKVFKKTAVIDLTADQGDYRLDSDILAFEDATIDPGNASDDYLLTPTDSSEIRRMRLFETSVAGPPGFYAYEGQLIMLYPVPESSSDKLHIIYVARPTSALAATGDDPSVEAYGGIPKEYHPTLESYVLWKAARYSNDGPSQNGEQYRADWERGVMEARILENRKAGVRVGYAKVGRHRHRYPRRPGVDLGY